MVRQRGDAEEDSDIDVAVICRSDDRDTEDFIWTIASDFGLEHDTFLDVRVISHERYYGEWGELSYLAEDIRNEGIPIWKRSEKAEELVGYLKQEVLKKTSGASE